MAEVEGEGELTRNITKEGFEMEALEKLKANIRKEDFDEVCKITEEERNRGSLDDLSSCYQSILEETIC